jgi:hypothetical protein
MKRLTIVSGVADVGGGDGGADGARKYMNVFK